MYMSKGCMALISADEHVLYCLSGLTGECWLRQLEALLWNSSLKTMLQSPCSRSVRSFCVNARAITV
jgi:hypothetical protein